MNTSEAIDLVSAAISAAQGTMKPAEMGATNPHFRSKYADLASVIHAIRDPLAKNGLGVLQDVQTVADEGGAFAHDSACQSGRPRAGRGGDI